MTDCSNAEVRDMLPDFLHDGLSAADAAMVEHHVVTCADCAEELLLLRTVLSVRPRAAVTDVARIVASLPKSVANTVSVSTRDVSSSVRPMSSAPSAVKRSTGFRSWRAAAAITVVALGGLSVSIARRGFVDVTSPVAVSETGATVGDSNYAAVAVVASDSQKPSAGDSKNSALSVGDLSDFSDDELEYVIQRLERWDGAAAADPLPGVPLFPAGSGASSRTNPGGTQ